MKKILAFASLFAVLLGCHSSAVDPNQPVKATLLGVIPVPVGGVCYAVQLRIGDRQHGADPADFPAGIPYTAVGTTVYITYHTNAACGPSSGDNDYAITITSAHL